MRPTNWPRCGSARSWREPGSGSGDDSSLPLPRHSGVPSGQNGGCAGPSAEPCSRARSCSDDSTAGQSARPASPACPDRVPSCALRRRRPATRKMGAGRLAGRLSPDGRTPQAESHTCPGQPIRAQPGGLSPVSAHAHRRLDLARWSSEIWNSALERPGPGALLAVVRSSGQLRGRRGLRGRFRFLAGVRGQRRASGIAWVAVLGPCCGIRAHGIAACPASATTLLISPEARSPGPLR